MRTLAAPIVVARPTGARIRTRLRLTPADAAVMWAVGEHLGRLSGADLAWRCRLGHASGPGGDRRTDRKRALTAPSSSRWAGAITRTSNDQWERAYHNLLDTRAGLCRARNKLRARLAIPAGQIRRSGRHRLRGYQSQSERFEKQRRLQHLQARLAQIEEQIAHGRVSVCRGGRRLAKLRQAIDAGNATCRLTEVEWRSRWEAARLFITADGEASKRWGNETIRVHPDEGWLELRLPNPLAYLSNTPGRAATYRLACPVRFTHRVGEWAAQATGGAVRYDIWLDPAKGAGRWYLDASWRTPAEVPPSLGALRTHRAVAIDLNADHLAGVVVSPSGSPIGAPQTIPLDLDDLPATTRDGRLRAAVSTIIMLAKQGGCRAIIIEDLNFADARQTGRELLGRGARAKRFRRTVSGIPTRGFRDLLVHMAANAGLWVIAVDAGWTSKWGQRYWQAPLGNESRQSVTVTRHHAAAVVIGRRGLGFGARRRSGVTRPHQRMGEGELPARPGVGPWAVREPGPPEASGQRISSCKTRRAERSRLGDQVVQDRSGPPEQDILPLIRQER
jgi:hypothetical protein